MVCLSNHQPHAVVSRGDGMKSQFFWLTVAVALAAQSIDPVLRLYFASIAMGTGFILALPDRLPKVEQA